MARSSRVRGGVAARCARLFGSLGLSCSLLLALGLLTWLGTLAQVERGLYAVQKEYFESFFLIHRVGPVPVPLPGAGLVMWLLSINLLVGGILRLRRGWATAGVLVGHLGIALLFVAGFVKTYFSDDGHVTLFEGQRASAFQSYYRWEIAVHEPWGDGGLRERVVPQEAFADAAPDRAARLGAPDLPFTLEVVRYLPNSRPARVANDAAAHSSPVVDGVLLRAEPAAKQAENDVAGAYVTVVGDDGARHDGILWGLAAAPWTVEVEGTPWAIELRKERYPLPFTIVLDDFAKEDHPRTSMPKSFSSDVTVIEDGTPRPVRISMNEPLRERGHVLYQASWGPANAGPGDPLFSTLAVVRNPADQVPLYACLVLAAGLVLHFTRKLARYVRREARA